jgi:hypothetical protein
MFDHFQSRCADALVELAAAHIADDADPDRATIVVHVGADTLLDGAGVGEIEDGPAISVETARRLACDARLQVVVDGPDGRPIGVGRVTRRTPPWLERMVRHRDQGCRFPGCGRRRWLHSHHVAAWYKDGGPTDLVNLVALCSYHHCLVHEGGWRIEGAPEGVLSFVRPDGRAYRPGPDLLLDEIKRSVVDPILDDPPPDDS